MAKTQGGGGARDLDARLEHWHMNRGVDLETDKPYTPVLGG